MSQSRDENPTSLLQKGVRGACQHVQVNQPYPAAESIVAGFASGRETRVGRFNRVSDLVYGPIVLTFGFPSERGAWVGLNSSPTLGDGEGRQRGPALGSGAVSEALAVGKAGMGPVVLFSFHLPKNIWCFPLLVLNGISHYWTYFDFSQGA